jgi:hypothetical protein
VTTGDLAKKILDGIDESYKSDLYSSTEEETVPMGRTAFVKGLKATQ